MALTGGDLNKLNGKYGISAPRNSVPVMKLIKVHAPKSKKELYDLIKFHAEKNCECGIKSQGSIEFFGQQLFTAQVKEWGFHKYTLEQCIQWEYDLFITQSLKGNRIEKLALNALSKILGSVNLEIIFTEGFPDEELRIDLIVKNKKEEICGIQVKPLTFNKMRESVIQFNKKANRKWNKPVFYLFYDDNEIFTNKEEITKDILKLI